MNWPSPTVGAGKAFSYTFAATGEFAYHCTIHTYMVAKVVVLAAGMTAPPTDALPAIPPGTTHPGIDLALLVIVGLSGGVLALLRFRRAR